MSNLYELYSKRTKYRSLRDNVSNAINVLSKTDVTDNLEKAIQSLDSNYLVNDIACKSGNVANVKEKIVADLSNLNMCLSSINSKIRSIADDIEEEESAAKVAG